VREQHVGPAHGLGALAMRVAGKNRVDAGVRFSDECLAERGDAGVEVIDRVERPQPQVCRDLIVARAAGVQLAGETTHLVVEQALHESVHVFVWGADRGAVGELIRYAIETAKQLRFFMGSDNSSPAERVHPRLARGDVLRPEAMIDGEAAIQRVERLARPESEASAPHLVSVSLLGHHCVQLSSQLQSYRPARKAE